MNKMFLRILNIVCLVLMLLPAGVSAGGVSPYLPLNKSPEIERKIERVLILAGRPVMTRPIPAAIVIEALNDARQKDEELCEQVEHYLLQDILSFHSGHLVINITVDITDQFPVFLFKEKNKRMNLVIFRCHIL